MQPPHYGGYRPPHRQSLAPVLLVVGSLVFAGLLANLFFLDKRWEKRDIVSQTAPPADSALKIRDLGGGWATYRLPEVKIDIDLPAPPVPAALPSNAGTDPYVRQDIGYQIQNSVIALDIRRTWYKTLSDRSVETLTDEQDQLQSKETPNLRLGGRRMTTFGDVDAVEETFTGPGQQGMLLETRLTAANRTGTIGFRVNYWASQRDEGSAAWKRILASIKPSDPDLPRDHLLSDVIASPNLPPGVTKVEGTDLGWATYRFADLKLDIDLPSEPHLSDNPEPDHRIVRVSYKANSDDCFVLINRAWYRDAQTPTLEELVQEENSKRRGSPANRHGDRFGDVPAIEEEFQQNESGDTSIDEELWAVDRTGTFEIRASFWKGNRESAEAALQRTLNSLHPSDPGVPSGHLVGASD